MAARSREVRLRSASLLLELQEADETVFAAIEELDHLTSEEFPVRELLGNARWKLGKATMARRTVCGRILAHLAPRVDFEAADDLRRLQQLDFDLLRATSALIGKWTIEAAVVGWAEYREASGKIRRMMRAAIEQEKRILSPILQALSRNEQPAYAPSAVQEIRPTIG